MVSEAMVLFSFSLSPSVAAVGASQSQARSGISTSMFSGTRASIVQQSQKIDRPITCPDNLEVSYEV